MITLIYRVAPEKRAALLAYLRNAFPFYERHGGTTMALYESVDDPGLLVELVAYDSEASYAADQERVASNPADLEMLKGWRALLDGPVQVIRAFPLSLEPNGDY